MTHQDNPAGRLHDILTTASTGRVDLPAVRVWGPALGVKDNDFIKVSLRVQDLIKLINDAEAAIRAMPEEERRDNHLEAFERLRPLPRALTTELYTSSFGAFQPFVSDYVTTRLRYASGDLRSMGWSIPVPTNSELAELVTLVRTLSDEVTESSALPPDAKVLILRRLRDVEDAIAAVRIGGFESVAAGMAAVASGVIVVPSGAPRGYFSSIVGRLFNAIIRHLPQVREINETAQQVLETIDQASNTL